MTVDSLPATDVPVLDDDPFGTQLPSQARERAAGGAGVDWWRWETREKSRGCRRAARGTRPG